MDPNATLKLMLETAAEILRLEDDYAGDHDVELTRLAGVLAQAVTDFNEWFTKDGSQAGPFQIVPSAEPIEEPTELKYWGHGIRFFLASEEDGDEMTAATLEYYVRHEQSFSPFIDETIDEAGSHSPVELWSDVILPAINDGRIEVTEWGATLDPPFILPS